MSSHWDLFHNQNATRLGGFRPGFSFFPDGHFSPVRSADRWAQLTYLATSA